MAIEFTLPVPSGQEQKFEQTLKRLKASGLKVKRTDSHLPPFTNSDGKNSVVTNYRTFEYTGTEALTDTEVFINAGQGISLSGNHNQEAVESRAGVFHMVQGRAKKYASGDANLDKLLSAVNKINKEVFDAEFKLSDDARACNKKDFIKAASQILTRFHARVDDHITVDKTSFAAFCLATNKVPNSHKVKAWIDEVKTVAPETISSVEMEEKIVASFEGTKLGAQLNTILSKDFVTMAETDMLTRAVESQLLGTSLKIDKNLVKEFIPENPNEVEFTGVVVDIGVHPSSVMKGEQYYIKFATDNNELIEVVSGSDIRIPKEVVMDSAANQTPITVIGEFVRTNPELKIGSNVMAPAVSTVKMQGYSSAKGSDLKDTIKVTNRVKF